MNHVELYTIRDQLNIEAEISSGSSVIESPASDPNPGFTTYPGLEITIFSGSLDFF